MVSERRADHSKPCRAASPFPLPCLCYNCFDQVRDCQTSAYNRRDKGMVSVGVIGSGAWGTTLALLLANKGITTTLWEHRPERAREMRQQRENVLFLPGFSFPPTLQVTADIEEAVREKELLLLVTPSQRMRENVRLLASCVGKDPLLVNASKGIEINALKRMTEVIEEELPGTHTRIAALSGPNIAREV